MYLPIFSKRHKVSLESGKISIVLTVNTKRRILYAMEKANERTGFADISGYYGESDLLTDLGQSLCEEHGWASLMAFLPARTKMEKVTIRDFVTNGAPHYVFDAIELYSRGLTGGRHSFQEEINNIFTDSKISGRTSGTYLSYLNIFIKIHCHPFCFRSFPPFQAIKPQTRSGT